MSRLFRLVFGASVLLLGLAPMAQAQVITCPTPPNQLQVTVSSTVTFDSASGLFTYQYTVASASGSKQPVSDFALDFAPPISNIVNPQGWTNAPFADRSTIGWSATLAAPLPPGVADVGQIQPGLFQVQPGGSVAGFSFQSQHPPGPVNFYVLGFTATR